VKALEYGAAVVASLGAIATVVALGSRRRHPVQWETDSLSQRLRKWAGR
jgi:hypothetical protein